MLAAVILKVQALSLDLSSMTPSISAAGFGHPDDSFFCTVVCSYSLVVLDNQNLQLLWDWSSRPSNHTLRLENGKVFFHINPKLCPSRVEELRTHAKVPEWSEQDVSPVTNGDRAACESPFMLFVLFQSSPGLTLRHLQQYRKR